MTDVCLVLEGTYPYVAGGVSTWIHQLVTAMTDLRFSILYISPFPNPRREFKYEVPLNVTDIKDLYLHEHRQGGPRSSARRRREVFPRLQAAHEAMIAKRWDAFSAALPLLRDPELGVTVRDVLESEESWDVLTHFYGARGEGSSFLDFFWTWRSIYMPLLNALTVPIPKARLYHTVSTGYAGLAASIAKATTGRPMLLTEHGVYTHERLLEISQADWIYSPERQRFRIQRELPFFKRFWFGMFEALGGLTYHHADRILTLYEGNKTKEVLGGADPAKITIIPNGIDIDATQGVEARRPGKGPRTVGFIGRVVSIKDVKTFLQAARLVLDKKPDTEFLILGPTDEEPEYTAECRRLADSLNLGKSLRFLDDDRLWLRCSAAGRERVSRFYDQNDLLGQYLNLYEQSMS